MIQGKHRLDGGQQGKFKKRKVKPVAEGSAEDVLLSDIKALRLSHSSTGETREAPGNKSPSFSRFDEVEVDIVELGSSGILSILRLADLVGDGLGLTANGQDIVLVPFTVPGITHLTLVLNIFRRQSSSSSSCYIKVHIVSRVG